MCHPLYLDHTSLVLEQFPGETVLMIPLSQVLWALPGMKEAGGKPALATCLHDIDIAAPSFLQIPF